MQHGGRPAREKLRGPAALAGGGAAGRLDEAGGAGDLAVEVARVQPGAPHRLVDPPQLATVNSGGQNAAASGVYSSLARARSSPSARIRPWSKASRGGGSATGSQSAAAASLPAPASAGPAQRELGRP